MSIAIQAVVQVGSFIGDSQSFRELTDDADTEGRIYVTITTTIAYYSINIIRLIS